ncbi:DegT/DnrJ/EryC1/StrS family aminotransferase [Candidatus Woesearchaeota archaeon]|nr:DegT/DnrJ/EryC1/StrS family aminotransferase [Candidatus Woesearchaeota archaeon]
MVNVPNRPTLSPLFFLKRKKNVDFDFKRVVFYPYARNALYTAFKLMEIEKKDNVLFPSFICRTAITPLLPFTKDVRLYKTKKNLDLDINDLKKKIDSNTKAIVVMHYFGFARNLDEIKKICEEKGIYLIEDCALALFSRHKGKLVGSYGDFAVFSLRKTLPLFEGGVLVVNNEKFELPVNKRRALKLSYMFYRLGRTLEYLKKGIYFRLGKAATKYEKRTKKKDKERELFGDASVFFKSMWLSRFVLKHCDSQKIIKQRRENFLFLLNALKGSKVEALIKELPAGVCPLFFPVLHENKLEIREKLWRDGIETLLHWNKILPEQLELNKYPDTKYLADRQFSIPIHQDLKKKHMEYIAEKLKEIIG